jgi:hypothetical protein
VCPALLWTWLLLTMLMLPLAMLILLTVLPWPLPGGEAPKDQGEEAIPREKRRCALECCSW